VCAQVLKAWGLWFGDQGLGFSVDFPNPKNKIKRRCVVRECVLCVHEREGGRKGRRGVERANEQASDRLTQSVSKRGEKMRKSKSMLERMSVRSHGREF